MPRGRYRAPLTPEERACIKAVHDAFPRLTYREIGRRFRVTPGTIWNVINDWHELRHAPKAPRKHVPATPPKTTSGLSLAMLTGASGRVAKLKPA